SRPYFSFFCLFLFHDPSPSVFYSLSLHDALPISFCSSFKIIKLRLDSEHPVICFIFFLINGRLRLVFHRFLFGFRIRRSFRRMRSEEHTSELQSRFDLVCRLLLEKKKQNSTYM